MAGKLAVTSFIVGVVGTFTTMFGLTGVAGKLVVIVFMFTDVLNDGSTATNPASVGKFKTNCSSVGVDVNAGVTSCFAPTAGKFAVIVSKSCATGKFAVIVAGNGATGKFALTSVNETAVLNDGSTVTNPASVGKFKTSCSSVGVASNDGTMSTLVPTAGKLAVKSSKFGVVG